MLVDDHAMFRTGVKAELGGAVDVVAEAADVDEAVAAIQEHEPDVVLLDVHLPGGGGTEVLRRTTTRHPDVRFLALSVSDAAEDVIAVIRGGARGYVTKNITGPELVAAIRRVNDGDAVFSPRLAGFVLDAFAGQIDVADVDEDLDRLTEREREVMRLIARGYAYKEVASTLVHLDQDGRVARVERAAQAAAVLAARADPMGERAAAALSRLSRTRVLSRFSA